MKVDLDKDQLESTSLVENELNEVKDQLLAITSNKQPSVVLILTSVTLLLCLTVGRFYIKRRKARLADEENEVAEKEVTVEEINELNNLVKRGDRSFMMKFHEYFPSFAAKVNELASPSLSYSEIEICAYTKLNFSTKDIALYRKCTIRSVENRKYRIRKKLKLNPDVDMVVWIASIK